MNAVRSRSATDLVCINCIFNLIHRTSFMVLVPSLPHYPHPLILLFNLSNSLFIPSFNDFSFPAPLLKFAIF